MSTTFSTLTRELKRRAARAYVSNFSIRSNTLRGLLVEHLDSPIGEPDSLLAPPVFEAMFGWQPSGTTLEQFSSPPLQPQLIKSLDNPPPEYAEQKFARNWHPHRHQAEAWRLLLQKEPASVVVSSGTGSGKTECFMVPILNSLAEEAVARREALHGVRAIFLYPLNALINSQRQRLRAWTSGLDGRVRFCLYNGNTPKESTAEQRRLAGPEIIDRKVLRESAPPILVTNTTMLEYMLVRAEDQSIIQASQGQLKWIVLDEAHTYLGSHAAELALLIRRVLIAFGVDASQVRFVATSATIGKRGDETVKQQLRKYLARVGGIAENQVHVVEGVPRIRLLEEVNEQTAALPSPDGDGDALYQRMLHSKAARAVHERLAVGPAPLEDLVQVANKAGAQASAGAMIEFLDAATRAAPLARPDNAFLRLRGHFFERVPGGLWACCNADCSGRPVDQNDDWRWGKVLHHRLKQCDACDSRVFDIGFCRSCGEAFLLAHESDSNGKRSIIPRSIEDREFEDESDEVDDDVGDAAHPEDEVWLQPKSKAQLPRLLSRGNFAGSDLCISSSIDPKTGELVDGRQPIKIIGAEADRFCCPCCSTSERAPGQGFGPFRIGQAFALSVALPALLEQAPIEHRAERSLPSNGRRLITFTDSRQGTATLALRGQLNAQCNVVRSFIYHELWARAAPADMRVVEELRQSVEALRPLAAANPALNGVLRSEESKLIEAAAGTPGYATISKLAEAWNLVAKDGSDQELLSHDVYIESDKLIACAQIPKFLIAREFLRRRMRASSMETMGLCALRYPKIDALDLVPRRVEAIGITIEDWKSILKLFIDFFVRANGGVALDITWTHWMGDHTKVKWIKAPDDKGQGDARKIPWPTATGSSRIARLIEHTITQDPHERRAIFEEAWLALVPLLTVSEAGFHFDLLKHGALEVQEKSWLCPVTRRVVDTTLRGTTPYLPQNSKPTDQNRWKCQVIELPILSFPWRKERDGARKQVELDLRLQWLESDSKIRELRKVGIWSEFSDRIAAYVPYARVKEHSAQVPHHKLKRIEKSFGEGEVNVLACSTTMEMGVDIGGVSIVGMNNAPPGPSNFLQRAGRAGRRGEVAAVSFTLCQDVPHAREVFRRPMWPFETPIHVPDVTLNSARIVQRHLNALLLGRFLAASVDDPVKLKTGAFFEAKDSTIAPADKFTAWLKAICGENEIYEQARMLVKYSALEGAGIESLLSAATGQIEEIAKSWQNRVYSYLEEVAPGDASKSSTAARAVEHHLRRLRGEYLLKFLTTERFLPGHGFPTLVVPFVNTSIDDIKRKPSEEDDAEASGPSYSNYASRPLQLALREYAPGNSVTMSGKVYQVAGLSLHWQRPPDETSARESQAIRFTWRCGQCSASGTRDNWVAECPSCGAAGVKANSYLQPSGMAVDIRSSPTNDLSTRKYLPNDPPRISTGGTSWTSLPCAELGRFRYSANGSIFHRTRGEFRTGFAVCLACGRADSERPRVDVRDEALPLSLKEHRRLRGGREGLNQESQLCSGAGNPWLTKRNLWLGVEETTDIFELQIAAADTGRFLADRDTAASIAIAMRTALAEHIGLEVREMGFAIIPARGPDDQRCVSIVLYDAVAGGAGFVANATSCLPALFKRVHEILKCRDHECDEACHGCLLGYDTARIATKLNRHSALKVVTEAFVHALALPDSLKVFGDASNYEFHSLDDALLREFTKRDVTHVQVNIAGNPQDWDLSHAWPLRKRLLRWCAEGVNVVVGIDAATSAQLPDTTKATLKKLADACEGAAEAGGGLFAVVVRNGALSTPQLITVGGRTRSVSWATPASVSPGPGWATGQLVRGEWQQPIQPMEGRALELKIEAASGIVVTELGAEVNGSIGDFGVRFWKRISEERKTIADRLTGRIRLSKICLRDRYLSSPLNVRLAFEILRGLKELSGGLHPTTRIEIETADRDARTNGSHFHHDWGHRSQALAVSKRVFKQLGNADFVARKREDTAHHREIYLEWADGKTALLRPDQGVTFMQARLPQRFNFGATEDRQAETIIKERFSVEKRDTAPVLVYIDDVK